MKGRPIDDAQFFFGYVFLTKLSFHILFLFVSHTHPSQEGSWAHPVLRFFWKVYVLICEIMQTHLSSIRVWMDDLCSEGGQRVYDKKRCCTVSRYQNDHFLWYNVMFEQISHVRTTVRGHPQLSEVQAAKSFQFWCFWPVLRKVEMRACETLRSWAERLGGLAITALPGASRSFNPPLHHGRQKGGQWGLWNY